MPPTERTPLRRNPTLDRYSLQTPGFPAYYSSRRKPRRWPLLLRFTKGSIHLDIAIPVLLHTAFTALLVYLDLHGIHVHLAVLQNTLPSLSIVVGLMLVFRNSTSYDRFWQGSQYVSSMCARIRNLTRSFLACSYSARSAAPPSAAERADTERSVRLLLALLYATKNHLRAEYGPSSALPAAFFLAPHRDVDELARSTRRRESVAGAGADLLQREAEYASLLPAGTQDHEQAGLSLLLQLSLQIEAYIKRGHDRGWFHAPQAAQMTAQLNELVAAYGNMETIHLTPLPVAILVHMQQVLAIFCGVLPFALVGVQGAWSVPMVAAVAFTLYGIDAIGAQLEDPFGYDRNDIKIDALVEDMQVEMTVLLAEWRRGSDMFPERFTVEKTGVEGGAGGVAGE